jgi:hypothetical protein
VDGVTAVVRLRAEAHMTRDKTVNTADLPEGANTRVGSPLVCKVSGDNVDAYAITEIRGSVFAPGSEPRDYEASVAEGTFSPGVVTPAEGADSGVWWEA